MENIFIKPLIGSTFIERKYNRTKFCKIITNRTFSGLLSENSIEYIKDIKLDALSIKHKDEELYIRLYRLYFRKGLRNNAIK